ncbi:hypothetical protein PV05_03212 [Exophiala xenobiotica]|uniref:Uncharacterized protein n=1 Tax=Exophiala xenobiotica TaxID=348802 RepID=A0A0D2ESK8_9EURO|nr:uncharacterized protein PV05_03212 [Exophiala xenobiotica]KIW58713.1 hypothetical protein PV05_03212 [Exophiala xenobiotica]
MFRLKNAISGLGVSNNGRTDCSTSGSLSDEASDQVPPLAAPAISTLQDGSSASSAPQWFRDLNYMGSARHSRASSVVSTRTKYSTTTLQEDARSIDINIAGQHFRISRDGSRITNDDPPPYAPPGETVRFRSSEGAETGGVDPQQASDDSYPADGAVTPRSTFAALNIEPGMSANILDPAEFNMPSPLGHDQHNPRPSSATLVEQPRSSQVGTPPGRGAFYEAGQTPGSRSLIAQGDSSPLTSSTPLSPVRRRGLFNRLPAIDTSPSSSYQTITLPQRHGPCSARMSQRPIQIRSAGAILSTVPDHRSEPRSPDYIGRNASGAFPLPERPATQYSRHTVDDILMERTSRVEQRPFAGSPNATPGHTPLPMDSENDISLHYAKMMRQLDYTHRKALHLKDKELAELRERLHEKDTVLRQQLRMKDFLIDDLRKRLANLEENVDTMLEKARNQVEDLWESRWKDRDFHMRERMRRIEEVAQMTIERLRANQPCQQEANSDGSLTPS